jgi:hypothetical protein
VVEPPEEDNRARKFNREDFGIAKEPVEIEVPFCSVAT